MSNMKHARVSGSPGQHARLKGLFIATWPIVCVVLVSGYLLRAALPVPPIPQSVAGLLFIALAVFLAACMNGVERKLADFNKGAQGEEAVARELGFLSSDYRVFNCIESGREALLPSNGDYDHVVIGPTGVFLIETKNWSGTITLENSVILYNGRKPDRPPMAQVKSAASSLASRLKEACGIAVEIKPVICFATNKFTAGIAGADGVMVCNMRDLNSVITDRNSTTALDSDIQAKTSAFLNSLIS